MLHRNRFFDFFPPPSFLAMPAVGLDISDRSIRFAELLRKKDYFVLGRYGEKEIPPGIISSGEVQEPEALKDILSDIQKQYAFRLVRVSLPEEHGYLIKLKLSHIKKKEIRGSLELQLEEYIPISPPNAIFDYQIITCGERVKRGDLEVGVAVISKRIVTQYTDLFAGIGLFPLSFELESHALARAIIKEGNCDTFMIVDLGATRTSISIVSEGIIRFSSTVAAGGNLLTHTVAKALTLDFKKAQMQKEKYGLKQSEGKDDMFSILAPAVGVLRTEINKHYVYWHTHSDLLGEARKKKIEKIILCGGEANVPGLPEYLAASLVGPVELANPWINIASFESYVPEISYKQSLRYVTALGLSLRSYE